MPNALTNFVTITATAYQPGDPEVKDWTDRVKALFPNDELSVFNMNGIGSAQVLVEALRKAGPDLNRDGFLAAMGDMDMEVDVYAGPIKCSAGESHQCNQHPGWLALDEDGNVVKLQ